MQKLSTMLQSKLNVALALLLLVSFLESCKKKSEDSIFKENSLKFIAKKTNVQTFEIIRLSTTGAAVAEYNAQFGSEYVSIIKTSDTTYSFIVPDVSTGTYYLKFDSSSIKFNVSKTIEGNPDQLVDEALKEFDSYILGLSSAPTVDTPFVESLNLSRMEILDMFNSLTPDEKKMMALFYEANNEMFKSMHYNLGTSLNGRISSYPEKISECNSKSTKYEVGICKASFFVGAIKPLIKEIGDALITLPSGKWKIPFLTATYLQLVHGKYVNELRRTLGIYFSSKWIFSDELFENINRFYRDEKFEDLNLEAGFRTINPEKDGSIKQLAEFFEIFDRLKNIFDYLPALGGLPEYQNEFEPITLVNNLPTRSISINVTDNKENVKLLDLDGESVKFNSVTDKIETFVYSIQVNLEGFTVSKSVVGTVTPAPLDTAAVLVSHGIWKALEGIDEDGDPLRDTGSFSNFNPLCNTTDIHYGSKDSLHLKFNSNGTGTYYLWGKDWGLNQGANCTLIPYHDPYYIPLGFTWRYVGSQKKLEITFGVPFFDIPANTPLDFRFLSFTATSMSLTANADYSVTPDWQYSF